MRAMHLAMVLAVGCVLALGGCVPVSVAASPATTPRVTRLMTGLGSGSGSTVGPDGALYVTDGTTGSVLRVDPASGKFTTFATGLPKMIPQAGGIGGPMDVAFIDKTAYALVSVVGKDIGGSAEVGIYRIDGPTSSHIIQNVGQWSIDNPPQDNTTHDVPSGVQYALQSYRGGFLVTDGHHNRVLWVPLEGEITQLVQFQDVVPTGLATWGQIVYVAQAGPVPHAKEYGRVYAFQYGEKPPSVDLVAAGAPLLTDVEFGPGRGLYALSQGCWYGSGPADAGTPAKANTGWLVRANDDGSFTAIAAGLNQPTSMEIIGQTAYVVTYNGEIWKVSNITTPTSSAIECPPAP